MVSVQQNRVEGRPTMTSSMAVFVCMLVLIFGTLLNADALLTSAEQKSFGAERTNWLRVWRPIHYVSHAFYLDRPRSWLDEAVGRDSPHPAFLDTQPADSVASPTVTPPAVLVRAPDREHPLRLWVGGDSMGQVFGQSLVRIADDTGLLRSELDYRISTGLSRPDVFDWPGELARLVRSGDQPEVMVIVFGANDSQGLKTAEGAIYQPQTDGWRTEYRRRVSATMDVVRAQGRLVVWLGQPIMRDESFSRRLIEVNQIFREEAEKRPGILFIDSWKLFTNDNGEYSAFLKDESGEEVSMRQADGIHLTRVGGDRLATAVLKAIAAEIKADLGIR